MAWNFIIHPAVNWDPVVDRDFLLLFQNFRIDPNQTIPNEPHGQAGRSADPLQPGEVFNAIQQRRGKQEGQAEQKPVS